MVCWWAPEHSLRIWPGILGNGTARDLHCRPERVKYQLPLPPKQCLIQKEKCRCLQISSYHQFQWMVFGSCSWPGGWRCLKALRELLQKLPGAALKQLLQLRQESQHQAFSYDQATTCSKCKKDESSVLQKSYLDPNVTYINTKPDDWVCVQLRRYRN